MAEIYQEQDKNIIFALDIGTRSIIGILGRAEHDSFHVMAIEKAEYARRAMLDGQIEDIDLVAAVARTVVQRLEERMRMRLKRVCVAAAGRALKSQHVSFAMELPALRQIGDDEIGQLEAGAVSAAEALLSEGMEQKGLFYMVGYTATQYRLDGYPISTMKDHRGKRLEVEVVATFLPCEVVESLYTVVARLGLEAASLTLEPIASLNAAIPEDIRLLNLALVDIGAGTSDIAICKAGGVVGYTMVTVAGDEISELLMQKLLIDFQTAERLKLDMNKGEALHYSDILGLRQEISIPQMQEIIQPAMEKLAEEIAEKILKLNGAAPSAVFLAGGGSKLLGLRQAVAKQLEMSEARVALAGNHFEKNAFADDINLNDPEYATPLGIAVSAALGMINDSYVVTLNGQRAKLFRSGTLTLRDILLMNGFNYGDMIGKSGANLTVTLNGQRMFFRGEPATPPELLLNGSEAALSDVVHAGDNIQFTPAVAGKAAFRSVSDLLGKDFAGTVTVNGETAPLSQLLRQGDAVESFGGGPVHGDASFSGASAGSVSTEGASTSSSVRANVSTSGPAGNFPPDSNASAREPKHQAATITPAPAMPLQTAPMQTAPAQINPALAGSASTAHRASAMTAVPASSMPASQGNFTKAVQASPAPAAMPTPQMSGIAAAPLQQAAQVQRSMAQAQAVQMQAPVQSAPLVTPETGAFVTAPPVASAAPTQPIAPPQRMETPVQPVTETSSFAQVPVSPAQSAAAESRTAGMAKSLRIVLNGAPVNLSAKSNGEAYYLMDMLDRCGLDFDHLNRPVELLINGEPAPFTQVLRENDRVVIRCID